MTRDLTNPSRDGRRFVRLILDAYCKGMIADSDYARVEREMLDVIRAERRIALRAPRIRERNHTVEERTA